MKILFPISSFYPAQSGGPCNSIYWLTNALNRIGIKSEVITTDKEITTLPLNQWITNENTSLYYSHNWFSILPLKLIYLSFKELKQVDVVHLTSLFDPPSIILAILAALKNKKVVWSPRGELYPNALRYGKLKKKTILWLIKKFLANKVNLHATSELELAYIKNQFGADTKAFFIPNLMELPAPLSVQKKHYFLYVGRIHPIKALDNLIEGFGLSSAFIDSKFVLKIAGDANNNHGKKLKKQVKDLNLENKIEFVGHVEGIAKEELFAGAIFSFLNSHSENFGNVVIESLAQGTPVVAALNTPWQILGEKKAGFWIDNSPIIIASTVDKILNISLKEYAEISDNALELVNKKFDIHKNILKWVNTYNKVLESTL